MLGVYIRAVQLLSKMIFTQSEDAEPIDRASGSFGVKSCAGRGLNVECLESVIDPSVDFLDPIISELVVLIDGSFDICDFGIGCPWVSCQILFMPKKEIVGMLLANDVPDTEADGEWFGCMPMAY